LIGQRELVTRPLPPDVADLAPVSGAAVLSDGDIALLVDCDALTTEAPAAAALPSAA
jgi:two-component system chemotaxis sensor kinase CheA